MGEKYIFTNILGGFVFDDNFKFIEKGSKKHKEIEEQDIAKVLPFFKKHGFFSEFYKKNLEMTKKSIKESVKDDLLIIHTIKNIVDIDKAINILMKGLREWYEVYNPEFSKSITNNEKFAELIIKKNKKELLKEIKVKGQDSMGAELSKEDLSAIKDLAKRISDVYILRNEQEKYLEKLMKKDCPNVLAIAGAIVGAKLIEQAGSLKRLTTMPASTIQMLGAEKALFRHMKTGARPPKYGVLFQHKLISNLNKNLSGKAARALADKISIAAKVDYFKGKFIGDKLKKELEVKFE